MNEYYVSYERLNYQCFCLVAPESADMNTDNSWWCILTHSH